MLKQEICNKQFDYKYQMVRDFVKGIYIGNNEKHIEMAADSIYALCKCIDEDNFFNVFDKFKTLETFKFIDEASSVAGSCSYSKMELNLRAINSYEQLIRILDHELGHKSAFHLKNDKVVWTGVSIDGFP